MIPIQHSRTILLVEDEEIVRRLLVRHFARQNIAVVDAADAESALEVFGGREFDAVITDVHLPGMSGLDLALAIRAIRPQQPIVFVTGDVDETLAHQALAHEGAGYLLKPFEFFELDAALRQALSAVPHANPVWAKDTTGTTVEPSPQQAPQADWRAQQRRLLEAASRKPVTLALRPAPRKLPHLQILIRLGVAVVILVLAAWVTGYYLGGPQKEPAPPERATQDANKTIYVPYVSETKQPAPQERRRERP